ncbi:MAG: cytochrome b/b6 domain-containing protein [Pseudomonadota bacterium]
MTETADANHPKPHSIMARTIHWFFVVFYAYAIYKGLDNVEQLQDTALLRFEMIFAATFLAILVGRFFFMKFTRPTAVPPETPKLMRTAARLGHLATYISVGMIAATGLMIGALYWSGATSGVVIQSVIAVHEFCVTASYVMIGLHISAAIFHRIKGDGIWSAMVPVFKETPKP